MNPSLESKRSPELPHLPPASKHTGWTHTWIPRSLGSTLRCLTGCLRRSVASGVELMEKQQGTIKRGNADEAAVMLSVSRAWFHAILVFIV